MIAKLIAQSRVAEVSDVASRIVDAYKTAGLGSDTHLLGVITGLERETAMLITADKRMKAESDLEEKDEVRDQALRALYYLLQGYIHHPDKTMQSAALSVDKVFENYGLEIIGENYSVESGHIKSLLEDLSDKKLEPSIAALSGCADLIASLTDAQNIFEAARILYEAEKAEEGTLENASALKLQVVAIINDQLVVYLRAMLQVDVETYGPFGRTTAQFIADNNEVVKKRGKKAKAIEEAME